MALRTNLIYVLLAVIWLSVFGWQAFEHQRVKETGESNVASRAHDFSAALSVVIRSQGRMAFIPRPRIEAALNELVYSTELESVVLLNASGEVAASAGKPLPVDSNLLLKQHEYWTRETASFANLVALGPGTEWYGGPAAVKPMDDFPGGRGPGHDRPPMRDGPPPFRGGQERFLDDPHLNSILSDAGREKLLGMMGNKPLDVSTVDEILDLFDEGTISEALKDELRKSLPGKPLNHETLRDLFMTLFGPPPGPPPEQPRWMNRPEYDRLIKERGIYWFLVSLPAQGLRAALAEDLRLRGIVLGGALLACLALGLAWRAVRHSANLEIQLVRERETATHLRDLNISAAGLVHETKNPLNLIRGMAQMISRKPDTPEDIQKTATKITEETDRVTGRLNQFLDYARPIQPKSHAVDMNRLIYSVLDVLAFDYEEKNVTTEVVGPQAVVWADEGMLRQTLFNLLLNAVQAVLTGGHVVVRIITEPGKTISLEVCDDGPGIKDEDCEEVFRPYYTTSEKGTGLGLAVVRQIAQAHHWTITCEPGNIGAVFRIRGIRLDKTQPLESAND